MTRLPVQRKWNFSGTLLRLRITRLLLVALTQPSSIAARSRWEIQIAGHTVDCCRQRRDCKLYFIRRLIPCFQLKCLILLLSSFPCWTNDKSARDNRGSTEPLCYIKCSGLLRGGDGFTLKIFSAVGQRILEERTLMILVVKTWLVTVTFTNSVRWASWL